ncbi:hypothetical protein ASPVEDRAFT_86924 [Aspergillus versicolor CBS 583.65]|uniref:Uncharacterized protein n=1 Tax=Aspergillus versicolor CBS 583.65 TaxID=1036611 RepID=A0A1L9PVK8_ASPVE|nr:uncharacterized protein ASPVEDRAFT_86924 [Aspergillus versicolor CBS 583.65]OJJ05580.1 hypothetical protein ASPVEDRAFT_86924 [Aspergillus versicolor CBS 583.65]
MNPLATQQTELRSMRGMKGLHGNEKSGFGRIPPLRGREDWRKWYTFIRVSAMAEGVWEYLTPEGERGPKPDDDPVLSPEEAFSDIGSRLSEMNDGTLGKVQCRLCAIREDSTDSWFDECSGISGNFCDRYHRKVVMPEEVARDLYGEGSVTLKRMGSWERWYAAIKQAAKWKRVWEYIDLDVEDDKLPVPPPRVHPGLKPAVEKIQDLLEAEGKFSEDDWVRFLAIEMVIDLDLQRRWEFDTGKGYIAWAILSTVDEPFICSLYHETDPRKMLRILKERVEPALPEGYEKVGRQGNRRNRRNR